MKIIVLFCLMILPMSSYSQFVIDKDISVESKILIEQAQNKKSSSKKTERVSEGFNFAITSSFTSGFVFRPLFYYEENVETGIFNTTAFEFYMPALASTPNTRFLLSMRFSMPIPETITGDSIFTCRLGYGIGFSSIFFDQRNKKGQGWTGAVNLLFGQDFDILSIEYIKNVVIINRIDLGMRWNYFVNRNFAFVFGLDIGGGFYFDRYNRQITNYGYLLDDYYFDIPILAGIVNIGLTVGFMF
ncbi:MAG: hypothetical protein KFW21_04915 [Spirochaetota bacterium]|nr:hypothetical protein [Spirochaetota bacterium]